MFHCIFSGNPILFTRSLAGLSPHVRIYSNSCQQPSQSRHLYKKAIAYLYQLPVPAIVLSQPRRNSPLEDSARVCRCSRAVLLHQLVTTNAGSFIPGSSFLHISVSHFNPSPNRARIILCNSGDHKVPSRRHLSRASLLAPSPCPLPFSS